MSQTAKRQQAPGGYRLRVKGHLDQRWSTWFDDLILTREGDGTTSISGAVTDQAELHGLLMKNPRPRHHPDLRRGHRPTRHRQRPLDRGETCPAVGTRRSAPGRDTCEAPRQERPD